MESTRTILIRWMSARARWISARAWVIVDRWRAQIGPKSGRSCSKFGEIRPTPAGCGPISAKSSPRSSNFGRCPRQCRSACVPRVCAALVRERNLNNMALPAELGRRGSGPQKNGSVAEVERGCAEHPASPSQVAGVGGASPLRVMRGMRAKLRALSCVRLGCLLY